jgi:signal transduction histidine kinase
MKSVDLVTVITDIAALVRQQSDYKSKNIQLDLPQQLRIKAHPQEMKQVLLNLLSNALQNTLPDGTVTITLKRTKSEAVLIVKDDGFGMTGEVLKNAFEPFYTNRRHGSGTGLGLSITHRIIEEHHGQMEAFSGGTNQGATFVVKLPLE